MSDSNHYQKYIYDRFLNHNITAFWKARTEEADDERWLHILNASMGLSGESGEVGDIIKKIVFHNAPFTDEIKEKLKLELSDVWHYWAMACSHLGFTTEEVMEANVNKLDIRYPNGFNTADSIKRRDITNE